MLKMTNSRVQVLIHQIEEKAKAKGWTLHKKGKSTPANKCPKCGNMSVLSFYKETSFGMEIMDVCMLHKVAGDDHCNMIFHVSIRKGIGVALYGKFSAQVFIKYNDITAPDGIRVCQIR